MMAALSLRLLSCSSLSFCSRRLASTVLSSSSGLLKPSPFLLGACNRYYTSETPKNYRFTKSHEWASLDGSIATFGISYYAQDHLGEAVYVDLPDKDSIHEKGDVFGTIESVKAVAELYAPLSGEVCEVNEGLTSSPELVNADPYGEGWIVKIQAKDITEFDQLMSPREYEEYLNEEHS